MVDGTREIIDKAWFDHDQSGLSERIKRVVLADEDWRLPNLARCIPSDMVPAQARQREVTIFRGVPARIEGARIRPGDWVSLKRDYAKQHGHERYGDEMGGMKILSEKVPVEDVTWAGTDMNEFFYAPSGLARHEDESLVDAANRIGIEAFDETYSRATPAAASNKIDSDIIALVRANYVLEWDGVHGASHWSRVKRYGELIAAENGADRHVVRLFAFLHDVQRIADDGDLLHGRRAAQFVFEQREALRLDRRQLELLTTAIEFHSEGDVTDDPTIGACWDADRLDLARLGIEVDPGLLCTAHARQPEMIEYAQKLAGKWAGHPGNRRRSAFGRY